MTLSSLVAALALLVQLFALPYHDVLSAPADIATVAADLKATFGEAAAVCVQTDGKGGPAAPARDCDDHCPLCRFASEAAALAPAALVALPTPSGAAWVTLDPAPDADAAPASPTFETRARAPPRAV